MRLFAAQRPRYQPVQHPHVTSGNSAYHRTVTLRITSNGPHLTTCGAKRDVGANLAERTRRKIRSSPPFAFTEAIRFIFDIPNPIPRPPTLFLPSKPAHLIFINLPSHQICLAVELSIPPYTTTSIRHLTWTSQVLHSSPVEVRSFKGAIPFFIFFMLSSFCTITAKPCYSQWYRQSYMPGLCQRRRCRLSDSGYQLGWSTRNSCSSQGCGCQS